MRALCGIAIIAVLSFAQVAMGAETSCSMEVPNAGNRAVLRVEGKNILLNYQKPEVVTSSNGLNTIGSALTFGAIRAKMTDSLKIKGGKASVVINNRMPEFLDLFVPLEETPEEVLKLISGAIKTAGRVAFS
jgi:hypothetical protein